MGVTWEVQPAENRGGLKAPFTYINVYQEGESRKGRRERENEERGYNFQKQIVPEAVKVPWDPCMDCEGVSILSLRQLRQGVQQVVGQIPNSRGTWN